MSSKRRIKRHACSRKRKLTRDQAHAAARALRTGGSVMDAYRCRFCGEWHVGHRPKAVRQAIAARNRERRKRA